MTARRTQSRGPRRRRGAHQPLQGPRLLEGRPRHQHPPDRLRGPAAVAQRHPGDHGGDLAVSATCALRCALPRPPSSGCTCAARSTNWCGVTSGACTSERSPARSANFTRRQRHPYEAPQTRRVVVGAERETVEESVDAILRALVQLGHLPASPWNDSAPQTMRPPRATCLGSPWTDVLTPTPSACWRAVRSSPLGGFMGRADYDAVLDGGRLASGAPFTIPVLLRSTTVPRGQRIALEHGGQVCVGTVDVTDVFATEPAREAVMCTVPTTMRIPASGFCNRIRCAPSPVRSRCSRTPPDHLLVGACRRVRYAPLVTSAAGAPWWAFRHATPCTARTSTSTRWRWRIVDGLLLHRSSRRRSR